MDKAREEFKIVLKKFKNSKITYNEVAKLNIIRKLRIRRKNNDDKGNIVVWIYFAIVLFIAVKIFNFFINTQCFIEMPQEFSSKIFRAPEFCEICESLDKIDKISNISSSTFIENYIKTVHPVIIVDGVGNWPAKKHFTFNFFKRFFSSNKMMKRDKKNCQFFPYHTEFKSLKEAFNVSEQSLMEENAGGKKSSWYIGWNNCNDRIGNYFKKFYEKPYFLSDYLTENLALSWIFMGVPGPGAHMHVDNVHYPSWQAQLRGKKLWILAPPPECYYKCKILEIVVEPGEIIVLDTNRWYHQTKILPGDLSITIGAEFD